MNRIAVFALASLAMALSACGGRDPRGMDVLTVAGAIESPSRAAFDPVSDKYFAWLGVDFPAARAFTRAELAGLPQHLVNVADEPLAAGAYEGPLLADVLDLAGVASDATEFTAYALDGYSAVIPMDGVRGSDPAILAISHNGGALPLGGVGPATIVFPDRSGADPAWYVWGLVLISVE